MNKLSLSLSYPSMRIACTEPTGLLFLVLVLLCDKSYPLAPAHPSYTSFESVNRMRRRLNITFNYQTSRYLNPEHCRYLSEYDCEHWDKQIQQTIHDHYDASESAEKEIQNMRRRMGEAGKMQHEQKGISPVREYRRLMQALKSETLFDKNDKSNETLVMNSIRERRLSLENQYRSDLRRTLREYRKPRRLNPSIGSDLRVMVLLVRFKGHESRVVPSKEYFDELFNGASGSNSSVNPVGSFKEFMRYNSLGRYRASYTVNDWFTVDNTDSFFAAGVSGLRSPAEIQEIFTPILDALDAAGTYDWAADGYIDDFGYFNHMVVLHSGYSAEFGRIECLSDESERDPANRLWSIGSAGIGSSAWISKDFYSLNGFSMNSAFDIPTCDGTTFVNVKNVGIGMIAHEYSHGFGLPDLYDQDSSEPTFLNIGGADKFALMSNGYGWVRDSNKPGIHDPWCRTQIGWLEPISITENGFYSIMASEISGQVYNISTNFPLGEYLLLENRQPIMWDGDMPNQTGLIIWHIDEKANGQRTRGYPGHVNWTADHYMVAVVQADRRYDIEEGTAMGDETDFWGFEQSLGSGGDFPNTDSMQGGVVKQTGLTITIRSNPGFIMSFEVQGIPATTTLNTAKIGTARVGNVDPRSTKATVEWILSMILGAVALVGIGFLLL